MKLIKQRTEGDCGVAALAMVCEVEYSYALAALESIGRRPRGGSGLFNKDLLVAAREMDCRLEPTMKRSRSELIKQADVHAVLSIIWNTKRKFHSHFVASHEGVLHDPAEPKKALLEKYLKEENARLGAALVRVR